MTTETIKEIERKREWRLGFHVVRLCEPTSTGCRQWAISLLYSLCMIFWMNTMCCEVSYLYILTQLSYLTYMAFLNIPPQTQGVIFNVAFEFGNKRIAQISWLNSTWLVSRLDGSDLGSEARWLGFWLGDFELDLAWSDHGSMARIATQWLRGSDLEIVLARDLSLVARSRPM